MSSESGSDWWQVVVSSDEELEDWSEVDGSIPYRFEPERDSAGTSSESEEDSEVIEDDRISDADVGWCKCGYCKPMSTYCECKCCQGIPKVRAKLKQLLDQGYAEKDLPNCITKHPGFEQVCKAVWSLQTEYLAYKQQYGDKNISINEKYRLTAYRQFTRWCWRYVGKEVWPNLPACAVLQIQEEFPSNNNKTLPKLDL